MPMRQFEVIKTPYAIYLTMADYEYYSPIWGFRRVVRTLKEF